MAIFWDLHSIPLPIDIHGQDIVTRIKSNLEPYGHLIQFHGDVSMGLNSIPNMRPELQQAGCVLVGCPHNGTQDMVNKMIVADARQFACQQPGHVTTCLITREMDAFFLAEVQKKEKCRTIAISKGTAPTTWYENCDIRLIWEMDIVQPLLRTRRHYDSPGCPKELIRNAMHRLSRGSGKSTYLKSDVASMVKKIDVSRFPNRSNVKGFLKKAVGSGILIEHGEGPYKRVTIVDIPVDLVSSSSGKGNGEFVMALPDCSNNHNNFGPTLKKQ